MTTQPPTYTSYSKFPACQPTARQCKASPKPFRNLARWTLCFAACSADAMPMRLGLLFMSDATLTRPLTLSFRVLSSAAQQFDSRLALHS